MIQSKKEIVKKVKKGESRGPLCHRIETNKKRKEKVCFFVPTPVSFSPFSLL